MNKKLIIILAGVLFMSLSIPHFSKAADMNNKGLNPKEKSIVIIAAFTAGGNIENLKKALNEGLDSGLTINEIKEILVQLYAYAGFPRSLNGIATFTEVLQERESKGIKDTVGAEGKPLAPNVDKSEYGEKVRTELAGAPTKANFQTFTPAIETFLKEHLFADIFARGVLTYKEREIATIAALTNIEGVNSQLQSHMNMGMNTGITELQMNDIISTVKDRVGKKEGNNAKEVFEKIMKNKK